MDAANSPQSRYSRQERFTPIGADGQRKLFDSTVLIVGCGALGSVSASLLVRAGIGRVRIVDRDFVDLSNLQRQVLFDEADVASGMPKAIAAAEKLRRVNSEVTIEPVVEDLMHENIRTAAAGADLIVDGTDNFETRLLVNDYAVSEQTPWVYGGCLGAEGQVLAIVPGQTACLSALISEPPPAGATPTCDTAGVIGPAVSLVASIQVAEALKLLVGDLGAVCRQLFTVDLWRNRWKQVDISGLHPQGGCPACDERWFPWLDGQRGSETTVLCGRNAVQLKPSETTQIDLGSLADRLQAVGEVVSNPFLVKVTALGYQITVFGDGRAIVSGAEDSAEARAAYSKIIGS